MGGAESVAVVKTGSDVEGVKVGYRYETGHNSMRAKSSVAS